jgi:hypothetical protein
VRIVEEIAQRNAKRRRDLEEVEERGVALPTFYAAHVRAMNARDIGEVILRPSLLAP